VDAGAIEIIEEPLNEFLNLQSIAFNEPSAVYSPSNIDLMDYAKSPNAIFLKLLPKFDEIYKEYEPEKLEGVDFPDTSKLPLKCGLLRVDQAGGTIQYDDNTPFPSSPEERPMKFLVLLVENRGKLVKYIEIAKTMNMNCWHPGAKKEDKDIHRNVQLLKKDVKKFLVNNVKIPEKEFDKMIINERNVGYKVEC